MSPSANRLLVDDPIDYKWQILGEYMIFDSCGRSWLRVEYICDKPLSSSKHDRDLFR